MEEKKHRRKPTRYSASVVKQICDMVREDTFAQREICLKVGLDETTFGKWKRKHPEFVEALEQAEADRMSKLVVEARKSLMKKVTGYDVKEHKTKTAPGRPGPDGEVRPVIREQTNITRHVDPDTTAIIFVLTNGDPEHFKNRHSQEITGANGEDLFKGKTDADLDKAIAEMMCKLRMSKDDPDGSKDAPDATEGK